jgi:hypothetical protein
MAVAAVRWPARAESPRWWWDCIYSYRCTTPTCGSEEGGRDEKARLRGQVVVVGQEKKRLEAKVRHEH